MRRPAQADSSKRTLQLLRDYESRNVTFIEADGSWPIVWQRAKGVHMWDAEGKKYLDLTAAFGVAAAGHANPRVIAAGRAQMGRLLHAMGDVHPHEGKARLARELSRITFERWSKGAVGGKTIFCNSGFESVEAALKTAMLARGKKGVIAFSGAYHGLGYGALNATHRDYFRGPFMKQLGGFAHFARYPQEGDTEITVGAVEEVLETLFQKHEIGAVLVEPVQGRGGIRVPSAEFLPMLRRVCDAHGALLIVDEVFTGFGRTGRWFACEHTKTVPDVICLGKALAGGFPISACVGKAAVMDAWPETQGEALHTSTFLGHPVGCAMALAQIKEIREKGLVEQSARRGNELLRGLEKLALKIESGNLRRCENAGRTRRTPGKGTRPTTEALGKGAQPTVLARARGLGLMVGFELIDAKGVPASRLVMSMIKKMLKRGFILLPEGEHGNVISFTPPLIITSKQLLECVEVLGDILLGR